ncbi:hypothetical protein [Paenibacillus ehimensis]|uniref:Nucleotidyl transferase AbiEii/AbiGii toxin family protein n=1 Tax=Paenibacillus ehimensis TaxID=79264 RepID=A0ABT8VDX9_9BACL|nr:hypothetical protein [Paenibacillus ehimensis]MDO3679186.1 hypothetical protein [Paenibacillus ehimensis]
MNTRQYDAVPKPLKEIFAEIAVHTRGCEPIWLVGGSTGLLLQGVQLDALPRDLDLYADRRHAEALHMALRRFAIDDQTESETSIYRSTLSHYEMRGVKVELVGAFEVRAMDSEYRVEADYLARTHAPVVPYGGEEAVRLMPLAHELVFNVLRDRPDRFEAIAKVCRVQEPERHRLALDDLISRNRFSGELADRLHTLLDSRATI